MSSKKKDKLVSIRKREVLTLKAKIEILDRLSLGESFASLSRFYNINESTLRYIKKSEGKIRNSIASVSLAAKMVRDPLMERMETALILWIDVRNQKSFPLNGMIIREKAKCIYEHFKERGECNDLGFQASEGWFRKFKVRQSLHNIKISGKDVLVDLTAAETYVKEFSNLIVDGGYKSEQVFNADETALFWKNVPNKTFMYESGKSTLAFEAAKDRATLLFCSNASGDCLIKPLMLYSSLNPQALRNQNTDDLPVVWRANKEAKITSAIFCDWFQNCFVPEVETYLTENNLDFQAVLVLDNAPCHPRELETMHPNVKVIFLPVNTTVLLQPLDQGIIETFKLYYIKRTFETILDTIKSNPEKSAMLCWKNYDLAKCIANMKESLEELKPNTLISSWYNLWPDLTVGNDEESENTETLTENIARIANVIGRGCSDKVKPSDIKELLKSEDEDLTETDLEQLVF